MNPYPPQNLAGHIARMLKGGDTASRAEPDGRAWKRSNTYRTWSLLSLGSAVAYIKLHDKHDRLSGGKGPTRCLFAQFQILVMDGMH